MHPVQAADESRFSTAGGAYYRRYIVFEGTERNLLQDMVVVEPGAEFVSLNLVLSHLMSPFSFC